MEQRVLLAVVLTALATAPAVLLTEALLRPTSQAPPATPPDAVGVTLVQILDGTVSARDGPRIIAQGRAGADDTRILQAALDEGGLVRMRPGVYRIASVTLQRNATRLEGEGWSTVLQKTSPQPLLALQLPKGSSSLEGIAIAHLDLEGNYLGGDFITNAQPAGFTPGADQSFSHGTIEDVKFSEGGNTSIGIFLRNPDNKLALRGNLFTNMRAQDIVLEGFGRDAGNVDIEGNAFLHGNVAQAVVLRTTTSDNHLANLRRVNLRQNMFVFSPGTEGTALLLERNGGYLDDITIVANSFEDPAVGIDVGGTGLGLVENVNIRDNAFFQRSAHAPEGSRGVLLRTVADRVLVDANHFEGDTSAANGWVGIEDQYVGAYGNRLSRNTFDNVDRPLITSSSTTATDNG